VLVVACNIIWQLMETLHKSKLQHTLHMRGSIKTLLISCMESSFIIDIQNDWVFHILLPNYKLVNFAL